MDKRSMYPVQPKRMQQPSRKCTYVHEKYILILDKKQAFWRGQNKYRTTILCANVWVRGQLDCFGSGHRKWSREVGLFGSSGSWVCPEAHEVKAELIHAQPTVSGLMGLTLLGTSVMPLDILFWEEKGWTEEVSKQKVAYFGDDFQTVDYTTDSWNLLFFLFSCTISFYLHHPCDTS